ncbi:hypothetical protein Xmau_00006 [Xenorhabdus mauleonii]|uniref:Lipase (Class 3) n=1 Tax=Xenorhabdus mauleonii TaxID=351675 RepID=A0A1I3NN97_9GAMM|nr:lipase family protein [Xenorhabdus mauleonii]PHM45626.1 hypothetical protein Xmau_00006 [Xenorhabdus mauleonii]SFJ10783.1 Lipase (class 3) [Xenorhabdus mauleonii]
MKTQDYYETFASLVLYAATMYEQHPDNITPPPDPRIHKDGWKLTGYIVGRNCFTCLNNSTNKNELVLSNDLVNFGFIVERINNPGEYVVAIRGSKTIEDFEHDVDVSYIQPWSETPNQSVFEGFYNVYKTLYLTVPDNPIDIDYSQFKLADAISKFIGIYGSCTITGHSLGSVVATYLTRDIYDKAPNCRSCLFASPKVGNYEFVKYVDEHFRDSTVLNYENDIITTLPPNSEHLSNTKTLYSRDDVIVTNSIMCNHAILTYLALINKYQFFRVTESEVPEEKNTWNECLKVSM